MSSERLVYEGDELEYGDGVEFDADADDDGVVVEANAYQPMMAPPRAAAQVHAQAQFQTAAAASATVSAGWKQPAVPVGSKTPTIPKGVAITTGMERKTARVKFGWNFSLASFEKSEMVDVAADKPASAQIRKCQINSPNEAALASLIHLDDSGEDRTPVNSIIVTHCSLDSVENTSEFPFVVSANWMPRGSTQFISTTGQNGVAHVPAAPGVVTPNYPIYDVREHPKVKQAVDEIIETPLMRLIGYESVQSLENERFSVAQKESVPAVRTSPDKSSIFIMADSIMGYLFSLYSKSKPRMQEYGLPWYNTSQNEYAMFLENVNSTLSAVTPFTTRLNPPLKCTLKFDLVNPNIEQPVKDPNVIQTIAGYVTSSSERPNFLEAAIRVTVVFKVEYMVPYRTYVKPN